MSSLDFINAFRAGQQDRYAAQDRAAKNKFKDLATQYQAASPDARDSIGAQLFSADPQAAESFLRFNQAQNDLKAAAQQKQDKQTAYKLYSVANAPPGQALATYQAIAPDHFQQLTQQGLINPQTTDEQVRQVASQHLPEYLARAGLTPPSQDVSAETKFKTEADMNRAQFQAEQAAKLEQMKAKAAQDLERIKANPFGAFGSQPGVQPSRQQADSQVNGDEYLKTLPSNIGAQVKALAEGRMAFPSGFALKTPYWQQMLSAVSQYDPNFDAVNYNARAKTRNDFTSGKNAQNIKALNTAIGHLGTLDEQIDGTSSAGLKLYNKAANLLSEETGNPGPTKFKQTASALASELTQVFRGSGGAEADIKRYLDELDVNASKDQKKAAVQNIANLLHSRTAAIGDQYNQGMGTTNDPLTLLNPHAQEVINRINGGKQIAQSVPNVNAKGWVLHQDAKGNKAYVSPDGKQFEPVQ